MGAGCAIGEDDPSRDSKLSWAQWSVVRVGEARVGEVPWRHETTYTAERSNHLRSRGEQCSAF